MSLLGGSEPEFDADDAFVPAHVPEPGAFIADHDVLAGADHAPSTAAPRTPSRSTACTTPRSATTSLD